MAADVRTVAQLDGHADEGRLIDISHNPRLSQLLGRIEEIRRTLGKLPPSTSDRSRYEHALAGFYIEVGKYVHWLMRQDPATLARVHAEALRWAQETDAFLGQGDRGDGLRVGVPAVDSTHDSATAEPNSEDMSVGDDRSNDSPGVEAIPELEPDLLLDDGTHNSGEPALGLGEEASVGFDGTLGGLSMNLERPDDLEDSQSALAVEPEAVWLSHLRSLMSQLGRPGIALDDPGACEMEKRRLVRATTNMETRWTAFPPEIKHQLLGFVASRAQAVRTRMAVDVELRLALGRMRRFREAFNLELLASLSDDPMPEQGSWDADAEWWWKRLDGIT